MGNKVATLLDFPKHLKNRRNKNKPKQLATKILNIHNDEGDDGDVVFCTPKSSNCDFDDDDDQVILQSSGDDTFICEIYVERRSLIDSFSLKGCSHFYCTQCVVNYVSSKLDESVIRISCPVSKCGGVLEPEDCKDVLPSSLFDRWGIALCESVIERSQRIYCPFKGCSVLLIDDTGVEIEGSYCPFCKRAFCARCKVPWHSEVSCKKYQKLKKKGDDSMVIDLAKRKNWRRCPNCSFYVEKSTGCFYINCRCGYAFCYKCGTRSSTTSHICPNPKCGA